MRPGAAAHQAVDAQALALVRQFHFVEGLQHLVGAPGPGGFAGVDGTGQLLGARGLRVGDGKAAHGLRNALGVPAGGGVGRVLQQPVHGFAEARGVGRRSKISFDHYAFRSCLR